jgi:redox-sensitive bicupin YhaK (pirin superfamily)
VGLQTVTWLLGGVVLHRDSLGSEQEVRSGQLNLMTAGRGVAHSEETTGVYRGQLHGIQLWVAQPAATRRGDPAFEHHHQLPQAELDNGVATVLVGAFLGAGSPARRDSEHVGVDLAVRPGRTVVPLEAGFEYALIAADGAVAVGPCRLEPGRLGYLGVGRDEVPLEESSPVRILLLGGVAFPEPLLMWWNYVARTRPEITAVHKAWMASDDRFGTVASHLPRIETTGPPWAEPAP